MHVFGSAARCAAVFLTLAFLLSACASQSTRTAGMQAEHAYQQRHDFLVSLDDWSLEGRLAASNRKDGGSGSLSWQNSNEATHMSFRGAMGKGAWELQAEEGSASLRFADGRQYSASSISQLVTDHTKSDLPVEALSRRVLGLTWSDTWDERQLDADGRLTSLRQLGWDVSFSGYKLEDQVWLPGKLVARNQDQTVKLAISDWSLQPASARPD